MILCVRIKQDSVIYLCSMWCWLGGPTGAGEAKWLPSLLCVVMLVFRWGTSVLLHPASHLASSLILWNSSFSAASLSSKIVRTLLICSICLPRVKAEVVRLLQACVLET